MDNSNEKLISFKKIFLVYEMQSCSTLIVVNKICKEKDLVELINFFF